MPRQGGCFSLSRLLVVTIWCASRLNHNKQCCYLAIAEGFSTLQCLPRIIRIRPNNTPSVPSYGSSTSALNRRTTPRNIEEKIGRVCKQVVEAPSQNGMSISKPIYSPIERRQDRSRIPAHDPRNETDWLQ